MESVNRTCTGLISLLICYALLGTIPAVAAEVELAAPTEVIEKVLPTSEGESETTADTVREAAKQAAKEKLEKVTAEKVGEETKPTGGGTGSDGETAELCDTITIDKVFKEYEIAAKEPDKAAGLEQIKKIQRQLKIGGYDPGGIDGVTGPDTDAALARLCVDHKVDEFFKAKEYADPEEAKKLLAAHLVELLFKLSDGEPVEEEAAELCDTSTIDKVFKEYERAAKEHDKAAGIEQIKRIQLQLKIGGYDPQEIDGVTGKRTDAAIASLCVDHKVDELFKAREYVDPEEAEKHLARHLVELIFKPTIDLSGEGCGCSRNFAPKVVYGFYPYLLAGGGTQEVDFSLLDRIGFHALVLNKVGEIQDDLQWRSEKGNVANFIHEAHKHRVKVDVTFYAPDWASWGFGATSKVAKNIASIARQEFHGTNLSLWHKILRLAESTSSVSVDGVNLYFEFNANPGSSKKISDIVTRVSDELEDAGAEVALNIILGHKPSELDKLNFTDLKSILVGDAAAVDKVFIYLPGNTSDSSKSRKNTSRFKKLLRQQIENAFTGKNRATVLRKFVPVASPRDIDLQPLPESKEGDSQFDDDLVYSDDNFAGIGLWPLPLKSRSDADEIGKALVKYHRNRDSLNYLGDKLEEYAPQVCRFVCPNRLYVYIGLSLVVGILVVLALLVLLNCRLRATYKRYFLLFLTLFLSVPIIFVISLVCDPAWERYVDRAVIVILLLFIAGFVWHSVRKAVRPKLP